ncbi:conserved hypothetical protein [Desulfamplus magnetovallimortis]|uniref:Phospholipid/glycerol acyltransferase domain-containing protein n=1 Tax=Desulfamplus magnetovallimortis TaxID=1246637 RepID=L0R415_9BACT|nr:lysophospholipid acyltransferase family protein [Desulfamplus magnetovallimortis]CCO06773.1 conserved hypothetical protein [Desulfamplus magnetovallimortis BW-1]SLM32824.1 conserved hypothetical protein [Desulfamplus magnetovallimortis]
MVVFKNTVFYILSALFTIIAFCAGLFILLLMRCFFPERTILSTLRSFIVLYGKCIVFGLGRLVAHVRFIDSTGGREINFPCVYVVNHRAASDAFLMAVLPGEFVQIVNIWPFRLPILGICAKLAGYISIREMPFDDFLKIFRNLVQQKVSVVCFPEGTRSGSSRINHFHGAIFRAAQSEKVSVIPVCIMGNEDKPKKGSLLIKPGVVDVHMLPPINFAEYAHLSPFALKKHVRKIMQDFIDAHENRRVLHMGEKDSLI